MKKKSRAYESIAWSKGLGLIIVVYRSGSVWGYKAKPYEYALMHRNNVSGGRYLNRVLKPRGGIELRTKPIRVPTNQKVSLDTAVLSACFNTMTGLQ